MIEEMTGRDQLIDSLRGFSMIVMILTHTTAYFLKDSVAYFLWDWSHFSVPIFIFCSLYLSLKKYQDRSIDAIPFIKKRFFRLLVPYYTFLVFFIVALLTVSPAKVTFNYIWKSIFLIGGVDINWLVLLFIYITLLLPFFIWSFKKAKILFWLFFTLSLGSSIYLLFVHINFSYKFIMWLPWSLILFFTLFYIKHEHKKKILVMTFFLIILMFILLHFVQSMLHHTTVLIQNKYPPNAMYLSYGLSILLGFTFVEKYLFRNSVILKITNFFSKYSYSIFFIHYVLLIILANFIKQLSLSWFSFFLIIAIGSAAVLVLFKKITNNYT